MPGAELLTPFDMDTRSVAALSAVEVGTNKGAVSILVGSDLVTVNYDDLKPGDVILVHDNGKKPGWMRE